MSAAFLLSYSAAQANKTYATAAYSDARSIIVVDQRTGKVLYQRRADASHPPASLTKMMTLYLLFEAIDNGKLRLHQRLTVSRGAARARPSKLYLKRGQHITVRNVILSLIVRSANDSARVAAEALAGSRGRFAAMMTRKARRLGMRRTRFTNASGLPNGHQRTTARDMATLVRALLRDFPHHYHYFSTQYFSYGHRTYRNSNRLLGDYTGVDGVKTGYTRRARYNLATSAVRNRRRVIVIVLGARSAHERFRVTRNLLDASWRNAKPGRLIASAPAKKPASSTPPARPEPRRTVVAVVPPKAPPKPAPTADKRESARTGFTESKSAPRVAVKVERLDPLPAPASPPAASAPNAAAPGAATPAATTPDPAKVVVARGGNRDYGIRVGVFDDERQAHSAAVRASWLLPKAYREGSKVAVATEWSGKAKRYTARLVDLTGSQARAACTLLSREGEKCTAFVHRDIALPPVRTAAPATTADTPSVAAKPVVVRTPAQIASRRVVKRRPLRAKRTARRRGRYAIQVGAHRQRRLARKTLRKAVRKLPRKLRRRTVRRVYRKGGRRGRLYRARLVGLTKVQAQRACQILRRKGERCMAIRHEG